MMPLSENKIAEECTEYAILCLRKKKKITFRQGLSMETKTLGEKLLRNRIFTGAETYSTVTS